MTLSSVRRQNSTRGVLSVAFLLLARLLVACGAGDSQEGAAVDTITTRTPVATLDNLDRLAHAAQADAHRAELESGSSDLTITKRVAYLNA